MTRAHSSGIVADLAPGDHICCLYETEDQYRAAIAPFLRQGLERNEKVLYITDARPRDTILDYLRDDGLDVEPYLDSGQLSILTSDETCLRGGAFDPQAMLVLLQVDTEQALADGYSALRVTTEMAWALWGSSGSERLLEYEARLNEFFLDSQCLALCQYDRRLFGPVVLVDVLHTHPIVVIGAEAFDNFYYTPPTGASGSERPEAMLLRWMENLVARKRAEEALRESEERYRAIIEDQTELICRFLPEGTITFVNEAYCRYFDKKQEELIDHSFMPLIPEEDQEFVEKQIASLSVENPVITHEHRVITPGGEIRWQQWSNRAIFDEQGRFIEFQAVGRDITERVKAGEALRESESRLSGMLSSMIDFVFAFDAAGRFTFYHSPQTEDLYAPPDAFIGKKHFEVMPSYLHERFDAAFGENKQGRVAEYEYWLDIDGIVRWFSVKLSPVSTEGEFEGAVAVVRDITGHKQVEEALRKAHDELELRVEERTADLAQANEELRIEIIERKRVEEALRKLAHDLGERIKELDCLYGISNLVDKRDIPLEELFQRAVELLPPSWQYPEITGARIILEGQGFRTENFEETVWKQASDIIVRGERIGAVQVCYLEEKPVSDEGPFLEEERSLINAVAQLLGRIVEHK